MRIQHVALVLVLLFVGISGCGGSGDVGTRCSSNGDCDAPLICYGGLPRGYCSIACGTIGTSVGCPSGTCGNVAGVGPICLKACATELDCRIAEGYFCKDISPTNTKGCQP